MNKYARLSLVLLACFYFWYYATTYTEWHFIDNVDLIFHEAGHVIFIFFGNFIHVLAGSGFQIALPLGIASYFFYTRQTISGSLCLMWAGVNLLNVSVYAADAVRMQLPLLGGDSSMHDWNYILGTLNLLRYTDQIGHTIYTLGILTLITGGVLAVYFSLRRPNY